MIEDVLHILSNRRFVLHDEKLLQDEIYNALLTKIYKNDIKKEYHLDDKNESIIDFLVYGHIGIEVKIKGQKRAIYRQCERYCSFDDIQQLILFTNVSMGFPEQINDKDCYLINMSKAWL